MRTGLSPFAHFLAEGAAQGFDPNPLFDVRWYVARYPDVAARRLNPLAHYVLEGAAQGYDPNPLFDTTWYLSRYPEVAGAQINPLLHYLNEGAAAGYDPNPLFDTDWYLKRYPDVARSGLNPLFHFLRYGAAEGRDPGPLFDTQWYSRQLRDVRRTGVNPLAHYLKEADTDARRSHAAALGRRDAAKRTVADAVPGLSALDPELRGWIDADAVSHLPTFTGHAATRRYEAWKALYSSLSHSYARMVFLPSRPTADGPRACARRARDRRWRR